MYWPWRSADPVVDHLRQLGPWFDRKDGADHIFVVSLDAGRWVRLTARVSDGLTGLRLTGEAGSWWADRGEAFELQW
eukprot:366491-Chlamydomonas_euryale.AAC.6